MGGSRALARALVLGTVFLIRLSNISSAEDFDLENMREDLRDRRWRRRLAILRAARWPLLSIVASLSLSHVPALLGWLMG
jgi:hypothetical protein